MPRLFDDEIFSIFNYTGIGRHGEKKVAMKNFSIFTDCMLAAWPEEADLQELEEILKEAVGRALTRLRSKRWKSKQKIKRQIEHAF